MKNVANLASGQIAKYACRRLTVVPRSRIYVGSIGTYYTSTAVSIFVNFAVTHKTLCHFFFLEFLDKRLLRVVTSNYLSFAAALKNRDCYTTLGTYLSK
jgi:hypothetical protein